MSEEHQNVLIEVTREASIPSEIEVPTQPAALPAAEEEAAAVEATETPLAPEETPAPVAPSGIALIQARNSAELADRAHEHIPSEPGKLYDVVLHHHDQAPAARESEPAGNLEVAGDAITDAVEATSGEAAVESEAAAAEQAEAVADTMIDAARQSIDRAASVAAETGLGLLGMFFWCCTSNPEEGETTSAQLRAELGEPSQDLTEGGAQEETAEAAPAPPQGDETETAPADGTDLAPVITSQFETLQAPSMGLPSHDSTPASIDSPAESTPQNIDEPAAALHEEEHEGLGEDVKYADYKARFPETPEEELSKWSATSGCYLILDQSTNKFYMQWSRKSIPKALAFFTISPACVEPTRQLNSSERFALLAERGAVKKLSKTAMVAFGKQAAKYDGYFSLLNTELWSEAGLGNLEVVWLLNDETLAFIKRGSAPLNLDVSRPLSVAAVDNTFRLQGGKARRKIKPKWTKASFTSTVRSITDSALGEIDQRAKAPRT